jgi:hypothetical protein
LHVLSTPPAFILSQDQTLRKKTFFTLASVKFTERNNRFLLFPITLQLLRFRQPSGLYSTRTGIACQEAWRDEMADALLSASARQTSKPLSCVADGKCLLSCNDLSCDEIGCNYLAYQLYAGQSICQEIAGIDSSYAINFQNFFFCTA